MCVFVSIDSRDPFRVSCPKVVSTLVQLSDHLSALIPVFLFVLAVVVEYSYKINSKCTLLGSKRQTNLSKTKKISKTGVEPTTGRIITPTMPLGPRYAVIDCGRRVFI